MFFRRTRLLRIEIDDLNDTCRRFIPEFFLENEFGTVWRFNGMSIRFGGENALPEEIASEIKREIAIQVTNILYDHLKKFLADKSYGNAIDVVRHGARELGKILGGRDYSEGDGGYENAAFRFIAMRILELAISVEHVNNIVSSKGEKGKYLELVATSTSASLVPIRHAIGDYVTPEFKAYLPMVASQF